MAIGAVKVSWVSGAISLLLLAVAALLLLARIDNIAGLPVLDAGDLPAAYLAGIFSIGDLRDGSLSTLAT